MAPFYCHSNIYQMTSLYILKSCQCFSISISIMATSTVFTTQIRIFDNCGTSSPVFDFLLRKVDIASDSKYFTYKKHISTPSPAFGNALFKTSIKSYFDVCRPIFSYMNIILFSKYFVLGADYCRLGLRFLCLT